MELMKSGLHILTTRRLDTESFYAATQTPGCAVSPYSFLNQRLSHAERGVSMGSRGENIAVFILLSPSSLALCPSLKADSRAEGWLPNG